ncbi:hypothetical protein K438DRAFT_1749781 [Mycena galopus ATCC 62051]|nr:hypothetical protein K438DRAFT_1749781 [Mycena galopus ATCC 62051]
MDLDWTEDRYNCNFKSRRKRKKLWPSRLRNANFGGSVQDHVVERTPYFFVGWSDCWVGILDDEFPDHGREPGSCVVISRMEGRMFQKGEEIWRTVQTAKGRRWPDGALEKPGRHIFGSAMEVEQQDSGDQVRARPEFVGSKVYATFGTRDATTGRKVGGEIPEGME